MTKPPRQAGWGPWRRTYDAAGRDAERLMKATGKSHNVEYKSIMHGHAVTEWHVAVPQTKRGRK